MWASTNSQGEHMKRILLFLIAFALCLGGCGKTTAAPPISTPATGNGEPAMVSSAPAPAPGGLLEDPEAEELRACEIRISRWVYD